MVRGAPLPIAAIFAFVGHGTTKKESLQDPAGRKAEKIWRHVQQEVLDRAVANIAALEKQNVELVNVLEIVVKGSNKNF